MSSRQPRRRLTAPSSVVLEEEEDPEDEENNIFESEKEIACSVEVSNDGTLCQFPHFYRKCSDQEAASTVAEELVFFKYELHFRGKKKEAPLEIFEGILLQHLAEVLGLDINDNCGRRGLLAEEGFIIEIRSNPDDQVIPDASCVAPVENHVAAISECQRVDGKLSLSILEGLTEAQELSLVSGVLREIRSAMDDDLMTGENIKKVVFMGQSSDPSYQAEVSGLRYDKDIRSAGNNSLSPWGTALLVLGVLLTAALSLFVVQRRRRQRVTQSIGGGLDATATGVNIKDDFVADGMFSSSIEMDNMTRPTEQGMIEEVVVPQFLSATLKVDEEEAYDDAENGMDDRISPYLSETMLSLSRSCPMTSSWVSSQAADDSSNDDGVVLVDEEKEDVIESLRRLNERK